MDLSKLSIADSGSPGSDQGGVGGPSDISPKFRDKLNKLAKWRIDPSLIEFPEGARKFEGGHATVSRALLTPASAAGTTSNNSTNAEGDQKGGGDDVKKAIAVKKLKIEGEGDRERVLGLALREAGLLVGLSHGHIIKLKGFVEDLTNERIWLIFPWYEHGNLKDFVASQEWEIPERICMISDVLYGVQYLHSQDPPIYHGDLKSVNVLVNPNCRAIITDFGSARRLTKKDADTETETTRTEKKAQPAPEFKATFCAASNTMTFTGSEYTLRWAAPELLMDDEPTPASDIWALGWIFYEVMTNTIPFEGLTKDSMIIKHVMDGKLPCVTDHIRMSLILRLCSLMVACWSVDSTQRPTAESCRKLMSWMPMSIPVLRGSSDAALSRARSPELLTKLGNIYLDQDDAINASKLYMEAMAMYEETSNNVGKADALCGLGQAHWAQSEYSKAATTYSEALQLYTLLGDTRGRLRALTGVAKAHADQDEYSKAASLYSEVIQASLMAGNKLTQASGLRGRAEVHRIQGDYDQAITSYSEALEIYTGLGHMIGRSGAMASLAEVKRLQTKYDDAVTLFSESLKLSTDIGDRFGRAFALWGLADIHRDQDLPNDALCLYEEAAEIFAQIGHTENAASVSRAASRVRRRLEGLKTE